MPAGFLAALLPGGLLSFPHTDFAPPACFTGWRQNNTATQVTIEMAASTQGDPKLAHLCG